MRVQLPIGAACVVAALPLVGGAALAQVPLSGNVYDGAGGPLAAGTIYHVDALLTVPVGQTLTIPAGAILKFGTSGRLVASGLLDVDGGAGNPVRFTSAKDDAHGGDTYLDGPTAGAPNDWGGITVAPGGAIDLVFADVAYAGRGGWEAIYNQGGAIALTDCRIHDSGGDAIEGNGHDQPLIVERCQIDDNSGWPINNVELGRIPGLADNTADGNGSGDAIRILGGTLSVDTTLAPQNLIGGALVVQGQVTVAAGVTLTLEAGCGVKFAPGASGQIIVDGSLLANGIAAAPVVLTSLRDDDFFGDTANDGPTAGAASDLRGVRARPGGNVQLEHTVLRYGGSAGWHAIYGSGGAIALFDCTIRDGAGPGVNLNHHNVPTVIERCAIEDNTGWAIDNAKIEQVQNFVDNTASGNALGDAIRLISHTVLSDTTLAPHNLIGGALALSGISTIPAGVTLTLEAGAGVKFDNGSSGQIIVDGALVANGTDVEPVVLTSLRDDDYFGDTENDGPTAGAATDLRGINARPGGSVELRHTLVRFGGSGGWHSIYGSGGTIALESCTIRDGGGTGIDLNGQDVDVSIVDCDVEDNTGVAIAEVVLRRLAGFDSNRAQGNALGDYVEINGQSTTGDAVIAPRNLLGGVLVVKGSITVLSGHTLALRAGTVLKYASGNLAVQGTLRIEGNGLEPVVLTVLEDDAFAGDTNLDGASAGSPGSWRGIHLQSSSTSCSLEHAIVRYAGAGGWEGVRSQTTGVTRLDSVRVEHGSAIGFRLSDLQVNATNLVAFKNMSSGIQLDLGQYDLVHATAYGNGSPAINAASNYGGQVWNTISWDQGPNYGGLNAGEMFFCNGDPALIGVDGNLWVDPQFVDAVNGDLRLAAGSPVLEAADLATAIGVVTDHADNSRLVRSTSGGPLRADMGAYERVLWTLDAAGSPAIGETMTLQVNGPAGLALYAWGTLDGTALISPYGFLLCGTLSLKQLGPGASVGTPLSLPVPANPALVGAAIGLQGFGVDLLDVNTAHLTNVARVVFEPALP